MSRRINVFLLSLVVLVSLVAAFQFLGGGIPNTDKTPTAGFETSDLTDNKGIESVVDPESRPDDSIVASGESHAEDLTGDWKKRLTIPREYTAQASHQIGDDVPLADKYNELVDLAMAGDPDAALELAASLSRCLLAPRSEEQLTQKLATVTQTRRIEGSAAQVDDLEAVRKRVVRDYEYCEGVGSDQVLDHFLYMKIAAENGSLEAKVKLLSFGPMDLDDRQLAYIRAWDSEEEMRSDELRFLQEAADAGDANAIYRFGTRLLDGSGHLPIVEAAGYVIAGGHLRVLNGSADPEMTNRRLDRVLNGLSASDADAAIEIANQLIEGDRCCSFIKWYDD